MVNNVKFAFWGTPIVASKTLQILIATGYIPSLVITNPDRPQGRGLTLTPSPVKVLAEENNIPVLTPEKIDDNFVEELKKYNIELSIVVAYGSLLPTPVIDTPKFGTLNIHYSLLPKWRGATPLEATLLAGDRRTGVTIQKMVKKLDAGDIVARVEIPIEENIDKESLRDILIDMGASLLVKTIPEYISGEITPQAQEESEATHCGKIKKEDGLINIGDNSEDLWHKYRAYSGWPGIYFFINKNGKDTRVKITKAKLENGEFIIEKVIPEGKKEISYADFLKNSS
jgi:methionyl-tRNA formyltransferase